MTFKTSEYGCLWISSASLSDMMFSLSRPAKAAGVRSIWFETAMGRHTYTHILYIYIYIFTIAIWRGGWTPPHVMYRRGEHAPHSIYKL